MTMTTLPAGFGRRGFLATGAGLAVGGCMKCTFPAPAAVTLQRLGDAHAHFFNAADLPIAGFAKFVLIPRYLPDAPDVVDALVDIIAYVVKMLTLTATDELRQIGSDAMTRNGDPTPAKFGQAAARAHRAGLNGIELTDKAKKLDSSGPGARVMAAERAASHARLAALLAPQRASGATGAGGLDAATFAAIAAGNGVRGATPTDPVNDLQCSASTKPASDSPGDARTLLHWVYLMCRPRCRHVEEYLKTLVLPGAAVTDVVNLLVDYDKWLDDDHPREGSEQPAQVAYWTRYADVSAMVTDRVRLHTFAGYDPLRHAEERVLQRRGTTTFDTLRQWALAGRDQSSRAPNRVAGFKVYPPMGFRPDTNADIRILKTRGGKAILERWHGFDEKRIGQEIDTSLESFFDFCTQYDIPVTTHARESNIALEGHGDDPAPYHWLQRAKALYERNRKYPGRKPLRLCIGHFDLESCPGKPTDHDVLLDALKLNKARQARMYFDLSFDSRILAGNGAALLKELAEICDAADDDGDYIMFGSDWIMLANQANVRKYLQLAFDAAKTVDFWCGRRLDKLFRGNLQRFLDPNAD